jgi:hypothetical protein
MQHRLVLDGVIGQGLSIFELKQKRGMAKQERKMRGQSVIGFNNRVSTQLLMLDLYLLTALPSPRR